MAEAVGSVWNPNSYHWEEKSYTIWAKKKIVSLLQELELSLDGCIFTFDDVKPEGEASASVRKGKSILMFDFKITAQWTAFITKDNERQNAGTGNLTIVDFSLESVTDNDYEISFTTKSIDAKSMKDLLIRLGRPLLRAKLNTFKADMESDFSDSKKINEMKERVILEAATREEAVRLKDDEKKQIAAAKQKEELEARKAKAEKDATLAKEGGAALGEGSVWNVNSYHWEEKLMSDWSHKTLSNLFTDSKISLLENTATVSFFNIKVSGEASQSIRKGKKLTLFDLQISADWKVTCRDEKDVFLADANGHMQIPEFESESLDEYEIKFKFDNHLSCQTRLNAAMKTEGQEKIRALLSNFVAMLEQKN